MSRQDDEAAADCPPEIAPEPTPDTAPEIRVRQRVSPAEVAALVAALGGAPTEGLPARRTPPWLRAGLREGLGGRPAEQPSDLR